MFQMLGYKTKLVWGCLCIHCLNTLPHFLFCKSFNFISRVLTYLFNAWMLYFIQLVKVFIIVLILFRCCQILKINGKWVATWDFQQCGMCDQQRLRTTCAYAQSDKPLPYGTISAVIGFIWPIISLEYWPLSQLTCWNLWHQLHRKVYKPLNKLLITNLLLSCHYFISYQKKI